MGMFAELVGKQIVVIGKDKFKKYGILLNEDDKLIVLSFRDSSKEYIPISNIASVHIDEASL